VPAPRGDALAELLGIEVTRLDSGHVAATLSTDSRHGNPHATVHGAVFYAVAGAAIAAAANDDDRSGLISSVAIDYLLPAALGDQLIAEVRREVSTEREDIFTGTIRLGPTPDGTVLAWVQARGTRRTR
jgi:acyl-CoA thioesterase